MGEKIGKCRKEAEENEDEKRERVRREKLYMEVKKGCNENR